MNWDLGYYSKVVLAPAVKLTFRVGAKTQHLYTNKVKNLELLFSVHFAGVIYFAYRTYLYTE